MMIEKNSTENLGSDINLFADPEPTEGIKPDYRSHPAIANSDLKHLHSPRCFNLYKQGLYGKMEPKSYFELGTAFEVYLATMLKVTDKPFDDIYIVEPKDINTPSNDQQLGFVKDLVAGKSKIEALRNNYKAGSDKADTTKADKYYRSLEDYIIFYRKVDGRIILSSSMYNTMLNMYNSLLANTAYNDLFNKKGIEIKYHLTLGVDEPIKIYGIEWKGELDFVLFDHINKEIYLVDLKTTSKLVGYFGWEIKTRKYYRQVAHYKNLLIKHLEGSKYEDWAIYVRILVVETSPIFESSLIPVPYNILEEGCRQLADAAELIILYRGNNFTSRKNEKDGMLLIDWDELEIDKNEPEETTE